MTEIEPEYSPEEAPDTEEYAAEGPAEVLEADPVDVAEQAIEVELEPEEEEEPL